MIQFLYELVILLVSYLFTFIIFQTIKLPFIIIFKSLNADELNRHSFGKYQSW